MTTQHDLLRVLQIIERLEERIEDLEAIVNDQSSDIVVADVFPSNPFHNQVAVRTDQPGQFGGGTGYRYDIGLGVWIRVF